MSNHPYPESWIPDGVRSRFVEDVNGLTMHVLEAGFEGPDRPLVLLLHGFPELAYSWRKMMVPLASAGYHVVAPDQRGYGRTTGWDTDYDGDLGAVGRLALVRDALGLVSALGYRAVAAVIGHDFGSPVAGWCALARPDIFHSVALMSAPFPGAAPFPYAKANPSSSLHEDLAALPSPRMHYQRYYQTREANENLWHSPQGIHAFLRGYYHFKSADWTDNRPHRLPSAAAEHMATMPTYYVMDLGNGMAETVAEVMPSAAEIAANPRLIESELAVYAEEFGRTGFQGGLQWYRAGQEGAREMEVFAGRTIDQPSLFISGSSDWGVYQSPGGLERMRDEVCTDMRGVHLVPGAGHWVQQEQPEETSRLLLEFLAER